MRSLLFTSLLLLSMFITPALAMNMDEAVSEALFHNPEVQQYIALEKAATARTGVARSPFFPRLDASYNYLYGDQDPLLASRDLSSVKISASYNLFNGGSDRFRLHEATSTQAAAKDRLHSIVADTVFTVKEAFIDLLRTRRTVETELASVELLERQKQDNTLRYEQGLIARNDLLRVSVELATANQNLLRVQGQLAVARQNLARSIGRPLIEQETVDDFTLMPENPGSMNVLRQEMFTSRSELLYLNHLLAGREAGRKAVRGDLLPDIDLVVSHERSGNGGMPDSGDPNYDSDSQAMIAATWTLFSGLDTQYELAGRNHEIYALQREIKTLENSLELQLKTALEEFRVAQGNLETAKASVVQAEENYRVNESRYQARVAATVDLLDAQEFLTRARNEQIRAFYDLHRAAAVIERVLERGPGLQE